MKINPRVVAGFFIAAAFLYLLFREVEWEQAMLSLRQANVSMVALAVILLLSDYCIRNYRWLLMLRCFNNSLKFGPSVSPFWGSFAVNNLIPLRAGDVLRVVGFRKQLGVNYTNIAVTLIVERALDFLALMVILVVAFTLVPVVAGSEVFIKLGGFVLMVTIIFVAVILVYPAQLANFIGLVQSRLGSKAVVLTKVFDFGVEVFYGINLVCKSRLLFRLVALTLMAWALEGAVFICVLLALGIEPAVSSGWLALAVGTLSTLIPSTPGYAGTFDYFTTFSLGIFGVSVSRAAAAAILIHLVLWVPITLLGVVMLWKNLGLNVIDKISELESERNER